MTDSERAAIAYDVILSALVKVEVLSGAAATDLLRRLRMQANASDPDERPIFEAFIHYIETTNGGAL